MKCKIKNLTHKIPIQSLTVLTFGAVLTSWGKISFAQELIVLIISGFGSCCSSLFNKYPEKINKQTIRPSYSGTSIQGTPSGPRQVSHEWRLGCSLLIINQQIKSISLVLPQKQLQPLFQATRYLSLQFCVTVELPRVQYIHFSEIPHVVKAVIILTGALLNSSRFFAVSHFFKC